MSEPEPPDPSERVVVLAPTARDAEATRVILSGAGLGCALCRSLAEVCDEIERGVGAALITQESVLADAEGCLAGVLARQPPWSDVPILVLTPSTPTAPRAGRALDAVGHLTLLKRPVQIAELVSAVRAALRDRRRQYEMRDLLAERDRRARELAESNERLAFALDAGRLGSWQLDLATGGFRCSPPGRAAFGLSADAPLTRDGLLDRVHPDDREAVRSAAEHALEARTDFAVECRIVWPDGSTHWAMVRGRGDYGPDGAPLRMAGVSLDVTDRKQAERRVRESDERYRTLAENVQQLFWTCLPDGGCDYLSRQWVDYTGVAESEQLGLNWLERVIHPDDRRRALAAWTTAVAGLAPYDLEYRILGADGRYRWFKTRGTPIRDPDGRVLKWFGTCTDIDDRKQAEEALQAADLRKDEFLAMLAHELRNPLAAVNNAVHVLRVSDDPENRDWAGGVVERQVKQLTRLIDDLLDVSRIRSGKIRLRREYVDAAPVLRQAVESARPLIESRRHRLSVSIDPGGLPVHVDPTRLEQIAVNLLTNAAKYTGAGGRISLAARLEGGFVTVRVRDNGIGILPEKLPEMFELFAQGERSIDRSEGGLGIGLTVVQRLAEMHGGSVSAASEGTGKGSEFTVHLPAAEPPEPERPRAPGPAREQPRGARILVVDDNVDTAGGMARLLKLLGHDVRVAHDGPTAVDLGRSYLPEFVLLDIGLPGMDGYQVATALRNDPRFGGTVIIAVSGYGQDDDRTRSRAAGFDHHLVKPVDHDDLLSLLAAAR